MPESEIFKVIIQLGSFGLLAVAVVWMLYYGAPMIRDTVRDLGQSHEKSVNRIADEMKIANEKHSQTVIGIVAEHTKIVAQMDANCRQERIHMAEMLSKSFPANGH